MSEHKTNPEALMAATIPPLLPIGHAVAVQLQVQVIPQHGVVLLPADRIRSDGEGAVEIYAAAGGEEMNWQKAPTGAFVHEFGKPLPPERCDVAVFMGTMVQDTLERGIVGPSGKPSAPPISTVTHTIIMRMPLADWQAQHLANLRGGDPS